MRWPGCLVLAVTLTAASSVRAGDVPDACFESSEGGQKLRDEGKLTDAQRAFWSCSDPRCPAVIRKACIEWLDDVKSRTPSIVVRVKGPDGKDVTEPQISIDGREEPSASGGRAVALDPGRHTVHVEGGSLGAAEQVFVAAEREQGRAIVLTLARPRSAEDRKQRTNPLVYVAAGTALVGLGAFAILGGTGWSSYQGCRDQACSDSEIDSARTRLIAGDVALGVGVVAAAVAVTLYFVGTDPPRTSGRHWGPTITF